MVAQILVRLVVSTYKELDRNRDYHLSLKEKSLKPPTNCLIHEKHSLNTFISGVNLVTFQKFRRSPGPTGGFHDIDIASPEMISP